MSAQDLAAGKPAVLLSVRKAGKKSWVQLAPQPLDNGVVDWYVANGYDVLIQEFKK